MNEHQLTWVMYVSKDDVILWGHVLLGLKGPHGQWVQVPAQDCVGPSPRPRLCGSKSQPEIQWVQVPTRDSVGPSPSSGLCGFKSQLRTQWVQVSAQDSVGGTVLGVEVRKLRR